MTKLDEEFKPTFINIYSMITNTIKETRDIGKIVSIPELNKGLMAKMDNLIESLISFLMSFIESLSRKKINALKIFVDTMMKISIIKLAITMVFLIFMTVLFFLHLHALDSVTLQFSKWTSSSLIGFILLIVVVKFIGVSIGITLTILTVKETTLKEVLLRFKGPYKLKLRVPIFFGEKVQPQIS